MRNSNNGREKGRTGRNLLAHLLMIVALVVLVCFVTDQINPDMAFMTSTISKWVICGLAVLAFIHGIWTIAALWQRPDDRR